MASAGGATKSFLFQAVIQPNRFGGICGGMVRHFAIYAIDSQGNVIVAASTNIFSIFYILVLFFESILIILKPSSVIPHARLTLGRSERLNS